MRNKISRKVVDCRRRAATLGAVLLLGARDGRGMKDTMTWFMSTTARPVIVTDELFTPA